MSGMGGGIPGMMMGGLLGAGAGFGGGNTQDQLKQFEQYTPEQQELLKQILGQVGPEGQLGKGYGQSLSYLQELLDPSSEAQQRFADPYMKQFDQETIPGLGERYAGGGALGGGLSSSGFGQAIGGAGANLQTQLASLKSQLQQGAAQNIMGQYNNMTQQGLGAQPFGYTYQPGGGGLGQQMFSGYAAAGFPGASQGLTDFGNWMKRK